MLAAALPLALYVATAGGVAYWLDSAEFTAAAVDLDIPHPPGHPLASLWGKLFTLLPVGPLPFRVALSQAVAAALALACAQRAIARSLVFLGLSHRGAQWAAVGAAWVLGGSYGFWFQAVRPEVYALAAASVCFALERLSVLATWGAEEPLDPRPFYAATLAIGLGLANHHFIAVLALPAFVWPFVVLVRQQGARVVLVGLATGLLGLGTYVYLPLRAAHLPPMDLGHPVTPGALAWVVSARVYAKNIGTEAVQPLAERFADLTVILVENLRLPALLAMVLGSYLLLRRRRTWPLATLWLTTAFVNLAGRAWLNPVRANPDVLGYMMPGFVAVAALAVCGLALIGAQLSAHRPGSRTRVEATVSALCVLAGGWALGFGYQPASLAEFRAPDLFDEIRYRALPEGTRLVLTTPQSVFRHFGAQAVERVRPDVTMVPVPFLDYGEAGEQLARKHPEVAPLIRAYLRNQELDRGALAELSRRHRVLLELDTTLTLPLYDKLLPSGLFYELSPLAPSDADCARAATRREALFDWLYGALGEDARELETRRQLLWIHYTDALFYARRGLRDEARQAAKRGLDLEPQARELKLLAKALESGQGPLDITPFLVGP